MIFGQCEAVRDGEMPPEPTTPPSSERKKPEVVSHSPKGKVKSTEAVEEVQSKQPPKKRAKQTQPTQPQQLQTPPTSTPDDDNVYSFDRLEASPIPPKPSSHPPQFKTPTPTNAADVSFDDSNVYEFDTLEAVTIPSRPPKPASHGSAKKSPSVSAVEDVDGDNIYEFDTLEKPPVIPKKMNSSWGTGKLKSSQSFNVRSSFDSNSRITDRLSKESPPFMLPRKPDPPASPLQFHDDPNVYEFDSLEPPTPTSATDKGGASDYNLQFHDDAAVYEFDTLDAKVQPSTGEGESVRDNLSPETGQVRKAKPSESYSLVPPNRPPPRLVDAQKSPSPGLPPRSSPPINRSNKPSEVSWAK